MHAVAISMPHLATPFLAQAEQPVDTHFHIFEANQAVAGARYRPSYKADLGAWSTLAHAQGVHRGVLVQPSFLGTDNSLLLQALQSNPALRAVAVIAPDDSVLHVQSLVAMHALGVRGIRLNFAGLVHDAQPWCRAPALWAQLVHLGWHLQIHTEQGELPDLLAQLLPHLPADLPLVMDHFARPRAASAHDATVQALRQLAQQGRRIFIKLSAPYRLGGVDAKALAQLWLQELGPSQLLWGSDWPCTNQERNADYAALRHSLTDVLVDPSAVYQALTENPHRLYA